MCLGYLLATTTSICRLKNGNCEGKTCFGLEGGLAQSLHPGLGQQTAFSEDEVRMHLSLRGVVIISNYYDYCRCRNLGFICRLH